MWQKRTRLRPLLLIANRTSLAQAHRHPTQPVLLTTGALLDRLSQHEDWLTIGAELYMRFQYLINDEATLDEAQLSSPSLFQLYLDGRPNDRVRVYLRGRMNFDFTLTETLSNPLSNDDQNTSEIDLFLTSPEALSLALDQFFLKFDIMRTVYITLGRQPVRWGSGRFWNPTDFLNQQRKDPLTIFDQRLGAGLVRLHLPIESLGWNFYAVANLEGASTLKDIGAALRGEFLFGTTELALSMAARKDQPLRLGADISTALGDFDIRVECALYHDKDRPYWRGDVDYETLAQLAATGQEDQLNQEIDRLTGYRENAWIPQISAGAEISILYSEQDSLILGAEYFYNDLGYADSSYYLLMLLQNDFTPFYVGRHYASAYLVLMQPGNWNDTNFTLSAISNLSDNSWLTRLDYRVRVLTYLDLAAFAALHLGDQGEMRFGLDLGSVVVPAPWLDIGMWMILKI